MLHKRREASKEWAKPCCTDVLPSRKGYGTDMVVGFGAGYRSWIVYVSIRLMHQLGLCFVLQFVKAAGTDEASCVPDHSDIRDYCLVFPLEAKPLMGHGLS